MTCTDADPAPDSNALSEEPPADQPVLSQSQPGPDVAPSRRAVVTLCIFVVNVVVYAVMVLRGVPPFDPPPDILIAWGGNYGPLTTNGEWWRLVSAVFLHSGAVHLLFNMYALWYVGHVTESLFGRASFLLVFLLSGLGGSLAGLISHPFSVGVGASGAVFGVYGALVAYLTIRRRSMAGSTAASIAGGAVAMIAYNLVFGSFRENVDVAAHIAGLVTGVVGGAALAVPLPAWAARGALLRTTLVALAAAAAAVGVAQRVPVVDDLVAASRRLGQVEHRTIERYNDSLAKLQKLELTRDQFADIVENELLPDWNAAHEEFKKIRTVGTQRDASRRVSEYMAAKGEALHLMAEAVRTGDESTLKRAREKEAAAQAAATPLSVSSAPPKRGAAFVALRGTVRSLGGPMAGAVVSLHCTRESAGRIVSSRYLANCGTTRMSRTDSHGQFEFTQVPTGPYVARVKAEGYAHEERTVDLYGDAAESFALRPAVDLGTILKDVQDVEGDTFRRVNESLAKLKAQQIRNEEFARAVETQVLPPWESKRQWLKSLKLAPEQQPRVDRVIVYMALRADAWRLTADGVRKNDMALLRRSKAKHDEAIELAKSMGGRNPQTNGTGK